MTGRGVAVDGRGGAFLTCVSPQTAEPQGPSSVSVPTGPPVMTARCWHTHSPPEVRAGQDSRDKH